MRKVGILLSLVLLFSFSYASAEVTPTTESDDAVYVTIDISKVNATLSWIGDSEFSATWVGLSAPDQQFILSDFEKQTAPCDPYYDKMAAEEPSTRPQLQKIWEQCLKENYDVVKQLLEFHKEIVKLGTEIIKLENEIEEQKEERSKQNDYQLTQIGRLGEQLEQSNQLAIGGIIITAIVSIVGTRKLLNKK